MRRRFFAVSVLLVLLVAGLVPPAAAQGSQVEGALLLIMDSSGSMNATDPDGVRLIDGAKQALRGVVDSLPDGTHVGLRVYGHREPNTDPVRGCQDSELVSPVQPLDREAMHAAIDGFEPSGFTPIGLSLQEAARDLPPEGPRTVILVSDGEDTCAPPDPCEVAADLRGDGVDLVVQTVGFALGSNEEAREQLACIAEAGGGEFRDVATAAELAEQLEVVSSREARRFELGGTPVEGGPLTLEAPDIDVNATYTDTIVGGEFLYYRVDVSDIIGSMKAQIVRGPDEEGKGGPTLWAGWVNVGDGWIRNGTHNNTPNGESPSAIVVTRTIDVTERDEVYLRIELRTRSESEYPVQLTVLADAAGSAQAEETEAPEETEEPVETESPVEGEPEETEPPVEEPEVDQTEGELAASVSAGTPGWVIAGFVVLALIILVLGAAIMVLLRRTAGPPTG